MESVMKRPAGVTVLAVLSLTVGIIALIQGARILGWVVFGPATAFSNVSFTGWMTLILGIIWISVGGALLSLRPWAWMYGLLVSGFALIEAFFGSLNGWQLGDTLVAVFIPLLILYYLNTDKVKEAFGFVG